MTLDPNFSRAAAALERALNHGGITLEEYRDGLRQAGLELPAGPIRRLTPLPELPVEHEWDGDDEPFDETHENEELEDL